MAEHRKVRCPECGEETEITRRDFMRAGATAFIASSASLPVFATPRVAAADDAKPTKGTPETAVKRLYESLTDEQRKVICKPFDDPSRQKYSANWAITKQTTTAFSTKDQKQRIRDIS